MSKIPTKYQSKSPEQALAHVVEELCEAATAGAKCLRFGPESVNPELPESEQETNFNWLRREMCNVVRAYAELDKLCAETGVLEVDELIYDLRDELQ